MHRLCVHSNRKPANLDYEWAERGGLKADKLRTRLVSKAHLSLSLNSCYAHLPVVCCAQILFNPIDGQQATLSELEGEQLFTSSHERLLCSRFMAPLAN